MTKWGRNNRVLTYEDGRLAGQAEGLIAAAKIVRRLAGCGSAYEDAIRAKARALRAKKGARR